MRATICDHITNSGSEAEMRCTHLLVITTGRWSICTHMLLSSTYYICLSHTSPASYPDGQVLWAEICLTPNRVGFAWTLFSITTLHLLSNTCLEKQCVPVRRRTILLLTMMNCSGQKLCTCTQGGHLRQTDLLEGRAPLPWPCQCRNMRCT